jgi:hypothetical protein
MPYAIKKSGNQWKVVNRETGRVLGTHPSKVKAEAQLKAVYANTGGK